MGNSAVIKFFKSFKISWLENIICFGSLFLLALMPFVELILQRFKFAVTDYKAFVNHLLLVTVFFAAMFTTKHGEHISISTIQLIKSDKLKKILITVCSIVSVFLLSVLVWDCVTFIKYSLDGRRIGFLTNQIFASAMPLGFAVIAFRFTMKLQNRRDKIIAVAAVLLGCAAALPAIAKIIWGIVPQDTPEPFYTIVNNIYNVTISFSAPLIILLIIAGLAGMPMFMVIGGIAMVMFQASGSEPEEIALKIFPALTNNYDLIAIPLFTLTGFFLSESKAGERLVLTFKNFFGWMPGGIIIATVVICAFFTSFTGASGVTILALGGILLVIMSENKYSDKFSIGMLTSAGGIGLMFPPSLPIILVATQSNIILQFMDVPNVYNVIHFFIGGIIPGIILVIAMILTGLVLTRNIVIQKESFNFKDSVRSLKESLFEILLPVILIVGFVTSILDLVQLAAVSVIYVLIVEVFIKKDIPISEIPKVFFKAVPIIGGILAIIAMANALSNAFIDTRIPDSFSMWMQNAVQSKILFLLLLNLTLFLLGCVMDIFSAILVLLPLIIPLGHVYGIDPVHLGIIFVINLEAGFLTPPVGLNLFMASYRFGKPFLEVCRNVLPFLFVRVIVVFLITYIPPLSTWLVGFFR
ncbi:MAG: TRAP transporter large permease subunit [Treponema sp.]|nr:TRAP transporter large permease subunit [Treponema sp.]